jgi:hypothetical protein
MPADLFQGGRKTMRYQILIGRTAIPVADVVFWQNLCWRRPVRVPGFDGSMALPENSQSFINEDPKQPAAKRALVFEVRRIPRGPQAAAFDDCVGSFRTAENATCDEVQQSTAPVKPGTKYVGVFAQPVRKQQVFPHRSPNIQCSCRRARPRLPLTSMVSNMKSALGSFLQWQRNGRRENAVGIEESLQPLQPAGVGAVRMSRLFGVIRAQHVGITAR